jgi:hypothetical protein
MIGDILTQRYLIVYTTFNVDRPIGDPSVWYRCYNFSEKLREKNITCDLVDEREVVNIIEYVRYYKKIIFFRPRQSKQFIDIINEARKYSIDCVASYDDYIFSTSSYLISSSRKSLARTDLIHSRYRDWANAFELFDEFIVTTESLRNQISISKPRSKCHVIDNWMPESILELVASKMTSKREKTIGYFGGGISHLDDIKSIEKHLLTVCKEEGVVLYIPEKLAENMSKDIHKYIVTFNRLDYYKMFELCSKVSLCVAPLILDANSISKSSIKLTEAVACGNPMVGTYIESYSLFRDMNSVSFIDGYGEDWAEEIIRLIGNGVNEDERLDCIFKLNESVNEAIECLIG